jgi:hypothetical protein
VRKSESTRKERNFKVGERCRKERVARRDLRAQVQERISSQLEKKEKAANVQISFEH